MTTTVTTDGSTPSTPRVILYAQTHHSSSGSSISLLPLVTRRTGITHVIVAAFHVNGEPGDITLNDDPPTASKFDTLWAEVSWLRGAGVKVLGMLGGAAKGSFQRLSGDEESFSAYYTPLLALLRTFPLDGLDLDIEEAVPLSTPVRLLNRLRADLGPSFLLTLAPTATALLPPHLNAPHLSGFSYATLEAVAGHLIAWYNAQFYCGWGDPSWYGAIVEPWPFGRSGWPPERVVLGVVTNPSNGSGFVDRRVLGPVLASLRARYPRFGGVMGWEYFNAEPGGERAPWEWAEQMAMVLGVHPNGPQRSDSGPPEAAATPPEEGYAGTLPLVGTADEANLPTPEAPFPGKDIEKLESLGFGRMQAVAALNATDGNVEIAAALLFEG